MDLDVELTPRQRVPTVLSVGAQVFTVVAALAVGAVALWAIDVNPLVAYDRMLIDTVTSPFQLTRTLNRAAPLILAGLAVYLPLKAGIENIGAEGQVYLGGIVAVWVALNADISGALLLPAIFLAGFAGGAVWAVVPAYMAAKWDVNEILTTLMLVFVAIQVNEFLINGPMQGGIGAYPRSDQIPDAAVLLEFSGTDVNIGILLAVAATVFVYLLLNVTRTGYEFVLLGSNPDAARQAGVNAFRKSLLILPLGAAFAGLAGMVEIAGNQGQLGSHWSPGYGWTAIPIALLGRRGAFQTMLAGLFFAVLFVGGSSLGVSMGIPAAISDVIEALVILFLIAAEFIRSYRIDVKVDGESVGSSIRQLFATGGGA